MYDAILQTEILQNPPSPVYQPSASYTCEPSASPIRSINHSIFKNVNYSPPTRTWANPTPPSGNRLLRYNNASQSSFNGPNGILPSSQSRKIFQDYQNPHSSMYSSTPISSASHALLLSPKKTPRHISKIPYKVLDAPELQDDFYLNLIDWGSTNILGVGLNTCVYLWNAQSGNVSLIHFSLFLRPLYFPFSSF